VAVAAELVPEAIAEQVWRRRNAGESSAAVSLWLARIGYVVRPDEVDVIASEYEQGQEGTTPGKDSP
jgi:hypothetical protein